MVLPLTLALPAKIMGRLDVQRQVRSFKFKYLRETGSQVQTLDYLVSDVRLRPLNLVRIVPLKLIQSPHNKKASSSVPTSSDLTEPSEKKIPPVFSKTSVED